MSTSLTVVGGVSGSHLAGIVTVPTSLPLQLIAPLQSYLSDTVASSVTGGVANFQNLSIGGAQGNITSSISSGAGTVGLLDITNTDTHGVIVSGGQASVSFTVPGSYNTLAVQAPGSETILGNGDSGFLAVFSSISAVTFNSNGGSGTVAAGGIGDYVLVNGTSYSVTGDTVGGDTINADASTNFVSVYGAGGATGNALDTTSAPSNVVGLAGPAGFVASDGTNDLVASYGGFDTVTVADSANVITDGGQVTVDALAGSTAVKAFFGSSVAGGTIDFINQSTVAASVTGSSSSVAAAGSVTVYGGAGGGYYEGGEGGNNSLIGGTTAGAGNVTLIGQGVNNYLDASYGSDALFAAPGGSSTLVAGPNTFNNNLSGGGTDSLISSGTGLQAFFVAPTGTETLTGTTSTVSGAINRYLFIQSVGGGTDDITNFRYGVDQVFINPAGYGEASTFGVSINGFSTYGGPGGGTNIQLNDGTLIRLIGTNLTTTQENLITASGGTSF